MSSGSSGVSTCTELSSHGNWYEPRHREGRPCPKCQAKLFEIRTERHPDKYFMGCPAFFWQRHCNFRAFKKKVDSSFVCSNPVCPVHSRAIDVSVAGRHQPLQEVLPSAEFVDLMDDIAIPPNLFPSPTFTSSPHLALTSSISSGHVDPAVLNNAPPLCSSTGMVCLNVSSRKRGVNSNGKSCSPDG